jgi:hypothetical protein
MNVDNNISGYAAIFYNSLMPLNGHGDFKLRYGTMGKTYMIDSPYWKNAVRIIIDHGAILVKGVNKNSKDDFLEEKSQCHAYINMPMQLLLAFVNGQASIFRVILFWLRGHIKLRGYFYIVGLLTLFNFFRRNRCDSGTRTRPGGRPEAGIPLIASGSFRGASPPAGC